MRGVDGVDPGVEHNEVGIERFEAGVLGERGKPCRAGHTGDAEAHEVQEVSTVVARVDHPRNPI